jgi:hypothetical protein
MSCTEKNTVVIPALRQRGNATTPNVPLYGISRFLDSAPLHPKFRRAGFWKAEPYSGTFIGLPA